MIKRALFQILAIVLLVAMVATVLYPGCVYCRAAIAIPIGAFEVIAGSAIVLLSRRRYPYLIEEMEREEGELLRAVEGKLKDIVCEKERR